MALIGVAGTQLVYFAAVERIPVGTAILLEYMAPLLLVLVAWARTRRLPKAVVLIGSAVAIAGLLLVVGPVEGGSAASASGGGLDPLGLAFAVIAMVGCAGYYVIAARPSEGLPPVALAASGLLVGGLALAAVCATGLVPFRATFADVALFGRPTAWWVPLLVIGVFATAVAYATSIAAAELLGSRLASFAGLLEVVAATLYAWLLLGEQLGPAQLAGGALILVGIGFVRSEKKDAHTPAAASTPSAPSAGRPLNRGKSTRNRRLPVL
jgi:drug/metabolite transporter (DMT)-like permease